KGTLGVTHDRDDHAYQAALDAAELLVDGHCGRTFTKDTTASARVFVPDGHRSVMVDDFHTTTDLAIKTDEDGDGVYETTWSAGDYTLLPYNGRKGGRAWPYTE